MPVNDPTSAAVKHCINDGCCRECPASTHHMSAPVTKCQYSSSIPRSQTPINMHCYRVAGKYVYPLNQILEHFATIPIEDATIKVQELRP